MPGGVAVDVSGAYFRGVPAPPDEGGRIIYANVRKWLTLFFGYATHDHLGRRNVFRVFGNVPVSIIHQHAALGLPSPASSAPLRADAAE